MVKTLQGWRFVFPNKLNLPTKPHQTLPTWISFRPRRPKDGTFDPADPWAQRSIMRVAETMPEAVKIRRFCRIFDTNFLWNVLVV